MVDVPGDHAGRPAGTALSGRLVALLRNPETPDHVLRDAVLEEEGVVASVYVVSGETGSYSDTRGWSVAGFPDRAAAEAECDKLNGWAKAAGFHAESTPEQVERRRNFEAADASEEWERVAAGPDPVWAEQAKRDQYVSYDVRYAVTEVPLRAG